MQDGGAPTLLHPASQQGGGGEVQTWQEEPGGEGGELGGKEGFSQEGEREGEDRGFVEGGGDEREGEVRGGSGLVFLLCDFPLRLSVLDTVLWTKVLANKCKFDNFCLFLSLLAVLTFSKST